MVGGAGTNQTPKVRTTATALSYNASTGALTAGSMVAASDERLKRNWEALPIDLIDRIIKAKRGTFENIHTGQRHYGVSAQDFMQYMRKAVVNTGDGMLGVEYGNAALVLVLELAERVIKLENQLKDKT
jgi:hypothetical protein